MDTVFYSVVRGSIGLGIFAVVTAGLIAVTQVSTADKIKAAEKRVRAKALLEIAPSDTHDNDMPETFITLEPDGLLGTTSPQNAYLATLKGEPVAVILPIVAPDGYSGDISAIVGIKPNGEILGVRVTTHKETPGLGDKIEIKKSNWALGFNGRSIGNPTSDRWKVKKDGGEFDQLTGATITPRAVVKAVKNALLYFKTHREQLFARNELSELSVKTDAPGIGE